MSFSLLASIRGYDGTPALQIRDLHKFYWTGCRACHVICSMNMDVPYGTIYALLGASGCGKTTLLRCVLGRLPIQSGQILVLGKPPGAKGHSVPGKDVGYMPQEEALAVKLTMNETMYYFGILFGMNLKYVKRRTEFLRDFLDLSTVDQLCCTLSGGQKRRVSLAAALLHEPPLLILDEPTVGLDPLLRAKIWQHLLDIASVGNTTIVMTTHYIEEARQAHMVGLMRAGRLLAQSNPDDLIRAHCCVTLEDVFLKLSEQQEQQICKKKKKPASGATIQYSSERTPLLKNVTSEFENPPCCSRFQYSIPRCPKLCNILALVWKEALKFIRQPIVFFFLMINPSITIGCYCLAYGRDLTDIVIYYNNYDTSCHSDLFNATFHLGPSFLSHVDDDAIALKLASSRDEGIEKIEDGRAWGYFNIPANFSENYVKRLVDVCKMVNSSATKDDNLSYDYSEVNGSVVELIMDVTNQQIYFTVADTLNKAAELMRADFLKNTSIPEFYFTSSLQVIHYVYGGSHLRITDFTGPSLIAGVAVVLSLALTASVLITERKCGLFDRTCVAGASVIEVVLSEMIMYSFLATLQAIILTVFTVYAFHVDIKGNIGLVILLCTTAAYSGVSFGIMLSTIMNDEGTSLELALGIYMPLLLIGGIMWPIQSLGKWLQAISYWTPITYPAEGIRSVLLKGWGLGNEAVYLGLTIPVVWTVIFLILACLCVQLKR